MSEQTLNPIEVNLDNLTMIGKGYAAEVYKDGDKVIKLYHAKVPKETVLHYYHLANHTMKLNLPVVKNYGFVTAKGRYGIVFDFYSGTSFDNYFSKTKKEQYDCSELMGKMLKELHSIPLCECAHKYTDSGLIAYIRDLHILPDDKMNTLITMIDNLPGPKVMVHGDYHEGNIMIDNNGPILIDLDTLCKGNPILDLGYVYLGHKMPEEDKLQEKYGLGLDEMREFLFLFLEKYFETNDRNVIIKYDSIIDHSMKFLWFIYSLPITYELGEEKFKKFVDAEYSKVVNELDLLGKEITDIKWPE